mmetsp:Transcript_14421/g.61863  ORF Transcript_14421/g.61863 Transcript_14421/m.61863 type:complete len:240 (-) Transcript_14421:198-917(-)
MGHPAVRLFCFGRRVGRVGNADVAVGVACAVENRHGRVVRPEAEVLVRPRARAVLEQQPVGVALDRVLHPGRQRDVVVVVAVRAAGVEREHHVQLQLCSFQHIHERDVGGPVVRPGRAPLDDAPPHVDHHALHSRVAKSLQARRELLHRAQLPLAGHRVQREHHVHGHAPRAALRPPPARGRIIGRARLHLHARVSGREVARARRVSQVARGGRTRLDSLSSTRGVISPRVPRPRATTR